MTALDPNQLIMYKLFRDSTKYVEGQHIKVHLERGFLRFNISKEAVCYMNDQISTLVSSLELMRWLLGCLVDLSLEYVLQCNSSNIPVTIVFL